MEEAGKLNTQLWPTGQQQSKNLAWQLKESQIKRRVGLSKTNSKQEFMKESVLTRGLNPPSERVRKKWHEGSDVRKSTSMNEFDVRFLKAELKEPHINKCKQTEQNERKTSNSLSAEGWMASQVRSLSDASRII